MGRFSILVQPRLQEAGQAAKIPDSVVYRSKWQIALELTRRCLQEGVQLRWITADKYHQQAEQAGLPIRTTNTSDVNSAEQASTCERQFAVR